VSPWLRIQQRVKEATKKKGGAKKKNSF